MGRQGAVRGAGGIFYRLLKFRGRVVMVMERVLEKVFRYSQWRQLMIPVHKSQQLSGQEEAGRSPGAGI